MFTSLPHWSKRLLASLPAAIPASCALCGSSGRDSLCDGCRSRFLARRPSRCACCALALAGGSDICGDCLKQRPAFDATIVAVDYAPPLDQLVLALKFGSRLELAPLFAGMLQDALSQVRPELPDILAPVPLGPRRLAERGFNQALEIARPLARSLGTALDRRLVQRQRDTHAQAQLHPDARRRNMRGAFLVTGDALDRVRGRHVGVIDDVMTTGETLNELAATLKRFGAVRVTNIVFARTAPR